MNNIEIKTVKTKRVLKDVFDFLAKIFYEDAIEHKEHYFTMSDRYNEMLKQFESDNDLLLYIENNNEIIGALTSKNVDKNTKKITLGVMAVAKQYRNLGYAKKLIESFEKTCLKKGITKIELGARYRSCSFYIKLGYKAKLVVQVYDFVTIEDIKKANGRNLEIYSEYQSDTYGFVIFKIDEIDEEKILEFEKIIPTAKAQYVFEKTLS